MAKTIKFNLVCDGNPVRTIEDLQNNFSIEDVLAYYHNGLLRRWLEVRGYETELESLNNINDTEDMEIVKKLIRIFDIDVDEKRIEENIYILKYQEDYKALCNINAINGFNMDSALYNYFNGYNQLVGQIFMNPNDVAIVKATIAQILDFYGPIFDLNHRYVFYALKENSCYLPIMCFLMNEKSREYYLPAEDETVERDMFGVYCNENEDGNKRKIDKKAMYKSICNMVTTKEFESTLGDNLLTFSGKTDDYWKDLRPKGKKYMIIGMGAEDRLRSAGHSGEELQWSDIDEKFVILDGIDYKSKYDSNKLTYMEV